MRRHLCWAIIIILVCLACSCLGCSKQAAIPQADMGAEPAVEASSVPWPEHVDFGYINGSYDLVFVDMSSGFKETVAASPVSKTGGRNFFQWCWSRDGNKIAYIDQGQLIVYSKDGRKESIAANASDMRFSHDGKRIAYVESVPIEEMPDELKNRFGELGLKYATQFQRLKVVELASKEIYIVGEGDLYSFDWSYDDTSIIYVDMTKRGSVFMHNIAEGSERLLLDSGDGSGSYYQGIESSPTAPLCQTTRWDGHDIFHLYLYDYESGVLNEIYDEESTWCGLWFPDGSQVVTQYEGSRAKPGFDGFIILDLKGTVLHVLGNGDEAFSQYGSDGIKSDISIAPDGTRLSFSRYYDDKYSDLSKADIFIWDISLDVRNADGSINHSIVRISQGGSYARWNPRP